MLFDATPAQLQFELSAPWPVSGHKLGGSVCMLWWHSQGMAQRKWHHRERSLSQGHSPVQESTQDP